LFLPFLPIISSSYVFVLLILPPPISPLFPYTTLFRSGVTRCCSPRSPSRSAAAPRRWGWDRPHYGRAATPRRRASSRRPSRNTRSEEHTSELQSRVDLVCRLLLEKKKKKDKSIRP